MFINLVNIFPKSILNNIIKNIYYKVNFNYSYYYTKYLQKFVYMKTKERRLFDKDSKYIY